MMDAASAPGGTAPDATLDRFDGLVGYWLRLAQEASFQAIRQGSGGTELRPGWYTVLTILADHPGQTPTALSRLCGRDRSTLTTTLHDLDSAGLITRARRPDDQRSYEVHLTPAGEAMLGRMRTIADAHDARMDAIVGADKPALLAILRRIASSLAPAEPAEAQPANPAPKRGRVRMMAAVALAAMLSLPGLAAAQDKPINLKISLWVPPAHPLVQAAKDWAADITKESGGTITATIFPAEQLGKAFDHYDMVRDGIADTGFISPGYQPGRFPIADAPQLPFTIANGKGGSAAVDAWYAKIAPVEMKDTHFCMAFVSDAGTLHSKTKIVEPTDVRGHKVRPAQATMGAFATALGATNVQASIAEARDILDRGVADSIFDVWNSQFLFGINNVTKFHIDVPMYTTFYVWPLNAGTYNKASAAQKAVFDHHCTPEWAERLASPWADFEAAGRELTRKAPGHTVVELTPEQVQHWKDAALPLTTAWKDAARKAGQDPDAVLAALKTELDQRKSGY